MKLRWLIVLIVLLGAVGSRPMAAQDEELPPYVMYFDSAAALPQFVIERADGSDSRAFGAGLMAADTNMVEGPGWSPSGEWFAWTAQHWDKFGPNLRAPYVLNADGSRRVTLPADIVDAGLYWNASRVYGDLLIVVAWREEGGRQAMIARMAEEGVLGDYAAPISVLIIDPATDTPLYDYRTTMVIDGAIYGFDLPAQTVVSTDDRVIVTLQSRQDGITTREYLLFGLAVGDDEPSVTTISSDDPDVMLPFGLYSGGRWQTYHGGTYESIPTPTGLRIVDRNSPQNDLSLDIELDGPVLAADWYGLVGLAQTESGLWRVEHDDDLLGYTAEPLGVMVDLAGFEDFAGNTLSTRWSCCGDAILDTPDGRWLWFNSDYGIIDTSYVREFTFDDGTGFRTEFAGWMSGEAVFVQRGNDRSNDNYLVIGINYENFPALDVRSIDTRTSSIGRFARVDDYVVRVQNTIEVFNYGGTAGLVRRFPPDARSFGTSTVGDIFAHPDQPYVIAAKNVAFAGGAQPHAYSVAAVDGSLFRELGTCEVATPLCAFFLPSQVDPTQFAPGQDWNAFIESARLMTVDFRDPQIGFDDVWAAAVEWSPDGTRIVAGGDFYSNTALVFNAETLAVERTLAFSYSSQLWDLEVALSWDAADAPTVVDRERIVYLSDSPCLVTPDGHYEVNCMTHQITNTQTGTVLLEIPQAVIPPHNPALSPDGRYIAYSGVIFDTTTGTVAARLPVRGVAGMAFSPDGTRLAVGRGTRLEVWDVEALLSSK